jgi:hypothetical protein
MKRDLCFNIARYRTNLCPVNKSRAGGPAGVIPLPTTGSFGGKGVDPQPKEKS